jgi:CHASE2 domain-containing sensor protein
MLGTLLDERYRLISALGTGGFGQTYLAEDTQQPDHSPCVIKQFKPASQDSRFLEVARRLFDTETATLRRLGQHDQIPQLLGFFEENQEFYIVQEFIDGQLLSDELSESAGLSEAAVMALLQDVLVVLEFVHSNRVIHRDIKPGNLIRRKQDGKVVLIDFGAVKEINTQLLSEAGQSSFTVAVGTQGYTPNEQLAGKPRYCSDIYALGMTAIQSLTRLQPSQLPEDPDTGELLWQDYAQVSMGLAIVINRMVRVQARQRYQSAAEVLHALKRIAELPTNLTSLPPSMLPDALAEQDTWLSNPETRRKTFKAGIKVVAIATAAVTGLLLGVRQLGWLEPIELAAFDQMTRLQSQAAPDSRLLIVEISEVDLRALQRTTPSDRSVAQVLKVLERYQPSAIGLDLYRDIAQEPGHDELLQQLQSPKVIAITELGTNAETQIPPPSGVPSDRIGFNDILVDPDSIVRRNLLFATVKSSTLYSFSLRVALQYLTRQGIQPERSSENAAYLKLKNTTFVPIEITSGGYQTIDAAGYQTLLQYRSPRAIAPKISFSDVLNGKIDPALIKDKIVLIGTTAPSSKDLFHTPYTAAERTDHQMSGITVHAQMVSQILSSVLDGKPLFWFWSDSVEILWTMGWAIVGSGLAWWIRHPVVLGLSSVVAVGVLFGAELLIFNLQGWVPVSLPAIALLTTGAVVATYRTYQTQQQQREQHYLGYSYLPTSFTVEKERSTNHER